MLDEPRVKFVALPVTLTCCTKPIETLFTLKLEVTPVSVVFALADIFGVPNALR